MTLLCPHWFPTRCLCWWCASRDSIQGTVGASFGRTCLATYQISLLRRWNYWRCSIGVISKLLPREGEVNVIGVSQSILCLLGLLYRPSWCSFLLMAYSSVAAHIECSLWSWLILRKQSFALSMIDLWRGKGRVDLGRSHVIASIRMTHSWLWPFGRRPVYWGSQTCRSILLASQLSWSTVLIRVLSWVLRHLPVGRRLFELRIRKRYRLVVIFSRHLLRVHSCGLDCAQASVWLSV